MSENKFITNFYLKYLCQKKLYRQALYFVFRLDLKSIDYPHALTEFIMIEPKALEETKKEILL